MRLFSALLVTLVASTSVRAVQLDERGIEHPVVSSLALVFLKGEDLHPSLKTGDLASGEVRDLPGQPIRHNPQLDSDPEFVDLVARISTHGRHRARGISSALYARYLGEHEIGFYGLEAATEADATWWEEATRDTWAVNERLGRARVHRAGRVVLVVWNDGTSTDIWEAVNAVVTERLKSLVDARPTPVRAKDSTPR